MSTTTQILFNSPALHSLKRDQLVKLCKIHSIKANGKNVDLVERLKSHAQSLPRDSPLSVAFRSEQEGAPETGDEEDAEEGVQEDKVSMPRPSSQWELVMDSIIEEVEESSSQGTLSSLKSGSTLAGEFGTGSSKSTTTVTSSIRALATSLGLKRHATGRSVNLTASSKASSSLISSFPLPPSRPDSTDDLRKYSTPYDALPPPSLEDLQTDHFTFDTTDPATVAANLNPTLGTAPLPGHKLRPGIPAPANARLSLGVAPRTPSKQGPTTTIRLVSFGGTAAPIASMPPPGDTPNLKPFKTAFDLDLGSPSAALAFPVSLYPALPASPPMDDAARRMSLEASMTADESMAVLGEEDEDVPMPGAFAFGGAPATPKSGLVAQPFVFGSPSPQPSAFSFTVASPDATAKAKLAAEVLEELNRRVFGEGGAPLAPAPAREIRPLGSAKKASGGGGASRFDRAHAQVFAQMESIVDVAAKKEGLKRKSSAGSVRERVEEQGRGKRVRVDESGKASAGSEEAEKDKKKLDRTEAEKEAVRRKLEASRARRRSSAAAGGPRRASGRVSGAGVLLNPKPKPTRGRFGFFAGAAKLVSGVWGSKKAPIPAPLAPARASSSAVPKPGSSAAGAKPPMGLGRMAPPPVPTTVNASASSKGGLRAPSVRSAVSTRSTAMGRARSPIPPSFAPSPAGTASSKATAASSARTRNSSIAGGSSVGTRNSSIAGASSIGTRTSSAAGSMGTRASSLRVGSLGTRDSVSSGSSLTADSARARPVSRLLAPTASSLAKMSGSPSLASVSEKQDAGVLGAITNSAGAGPSGVDSVKGAIKAGGKARLLPAAPGRKPRISRSRVIAKLASQRVASGSSMVSVASGASARKSLGGGRARSSLGVKAQRGSLGGIKNMGMGMGGALDAKKRARQSEYYARRKSRAAETEAGPDAMQVDT
ncbi:hypothetical protein B0H15DRAFT_831238 [Mycena belliarum]|uniref:SAP domain-containing protein n=1 Tax=Mycena belliarum TaxID=1033014 RepID=A0AAD6XPL3_9AGAR|nr:hypothetical protein B0H15DRAFT_831238 [Mycena belliae]